ncbi:hypothetical protein BDZ45DRAFT_706897 [Acephala macrosclerotiorum]|nr:hypothetical protein BDZ45DRAFT_706897 [Acephala macrosclerotiorum]
MEMESSPSYDVQTDRNAGKSIAHSSTGDRRNLKRRLHLNCRECRKKKVPAPMHTRGDRAAILMIYPSAAIVRLKLPLPEVPIAQQQAWRNVDEIRDVRAEVAQLKKVLSKGPGRGGSECANENSRFADRHGEAALLEGKYKERLTPLEGTEDELSDPRQRSSHAYYSQHTLLQFSKEIPQLFPFIRETNKSPKNDRKANVPSQGAVSQEALLPPKDDTDILVLFYLQHSEQLHRILHISTFKREYANFWMPRFTRYPAMTTLTLSTISISCASASSGVAASIASRYQTIPVHSKHRKLVHYQISCLVYLAKRMNIIRKKRWRKETGLWSGIHLLVVSNATQIADSPYMREIKGRIWAVLRELDLQSSFEYGLPSQLYSIDSDVAAPANLNDEDFDEGSKLIPTSRLQNHYTYVSYQSHSSRSWELRLEISRQLFNTGVSKALGYDDVLKYTHELTQAMNSLSSGDVDEVKGEDSAHRPVLAYTYLYFQLKECLFALINYISREVKACFGFQKTYSLTLLREDLLLASLNLCRITMLQPKGSTSIIMANRDSTVGLLAQCLPLMKDQYLRCCYGEPWCFLTMCAATILLKIHPGKERHQTSLPSQQNSTSPGFVAQIDVSSLPSTLGRVSFIRKLGAV